MGFGPFSSESKSSSKDDHSNRPITADAGGLASGVQAGNVGRIVSPGGTLYEIAKGAHVTFTASDNGAQAAAAAILDKVVSSQANLSSGALSKLSDLSTTKVTDGANL